MGAKITTCLRSAITVCLLAVSATPCLRGETAHPRLWLTHDAENAVRETIPRDPLAARYHDALMAEADRVLSARTCRYDIPDGRRLLRESRLALHNIMHAGWAWRMTGGETYKARVIAELEAACALKDWNPAHFLDTAEMATAVATGYDWLYSALTPEQRAMCEKAVLEKALLPAREAIARKSFWTRPVSNWSQVCGAGIALAASVVPAGDPAMRAELLKHCLDLVDGCDRFYQPDGVYPEGPGYWHYGTNYHVMLLAARQALGHGPGKSERALRSTGRAMIHLTGPTRLVFNFADGRASSGGISPAQCWLASRFDDPLQVRHVRKELERDLAKNDGRVARGNSPLGLIWLPAADSGNEEPPKSAVFGGSQPLATFRTGWNDRDVWLAVKGGTPAESHGQMDVGSFVFDAHGTRWFHDMGPDNYNLPGYFGGKRWSYYRMQNRSHNTLEIAGMLQDAITGSCPLVDSATTGDVHHAAFDLTAAYHPSAERVLRRVRFDPETGMARIGDQVTAPKGPVVWRAFTDADIELRGTEAVLTKKEGRILLRSKGANWRVDAATPPNADEHQNENFRALTLEYPAADNVSIVVEIQP
ncbi:MAG TPA: heparinase II/III family protein [Luteolibacter sp.]|nr:heparinase II/III family protein [Luteolibacter sp.]